MRASIFRWGAVVGLGAVALGSFGCVDVFEQDSELFIMNQMHQVKDGDDVLAGSGCAAIDSSGSGSDRSALGSAPHRAPMCRALPCGVSPAQLRRSMERALTSRVRAARLRKRLGAQWQQTRR